MIETLKFVIGAIVVVAVLWLVLTRLGRFLSWVERSEIARQKAEAAEDAGRKQAAAAKAVALAPAASRVDAAGVPADHVVAIAAAVAAYGVPGGAYRGRRDRERLGRGRPLAAPDVA